MPAAQVKFLGLLDTVSPHTDWMRLEWRSYDMSIKEHTAHIRHALALHGPRRPFTPDAITIEPETFDQDKRTFKQAWFIGSHEDIGGGNDQDGLSLYPLQWMFFESRGQGLTLAYEKLEGPLASVENPLDVVRYQDHASSDSLIVQTANGIETEMRNISSCHASRRYAVKLNQMVSARVSGKAREPFLKKKLQGYYDERE